MPAPIQVEGLKELNRAIGKAVDRDLPKRMGQANKKVGERVIALLEPKPDPRAVGEGQGATVRASATRSQVVLRVGGSFRTHSPMEQWGRRRVSSHGGPVPKRPFISGTVRRNQALVEAIYLTAVEDALAAAFVKE